MLLTWIHGNVGTGGTMSYDSLPALIIGPYVNDTNHHKGGIMFPDIHECINMPRSGVRITYTREYSDLSYDSWRMIIYRETTAEDLERNSYFENIGDPIWVTAIDIIHCPFCGKNLYEGMTEQNIPAGNAVHVDYSDWSSKIS